MAFLPRSVENMNMPFFLFFLPASMEPNNLQSEAVPHDNGKLKLSSATYKIARFHIYDWIALFGLIILYGVLNLIDPFYRFIGETMIGDYMYPLKSNTIPFQVVPVSLFPTCV